MKDSLQLVAIPLALLVGFILVIAKTIHHAMGVKRALHSAIGYDVSAEENENSVISYLREKVVQQDQDKDRNPPYLLHRPLSEVLDEIVDHELGGGWFVLASLSTAVALVFTFGLVAWVLITDIPNAINIGSTDISANVTASASAAAASERLSHAVTLLGGKFFISAAGILVLVASSIINARLRRMLRSEAATTATRLRDLFLTPDVLATRYQKEQLEELRKLRTDEDARMNILTGNHIALMTSLGDSHTGMRHLEQALFEQLGILRGELRETRNTIVAFHNTADSKLKNLASIAEYTSPLRTELQETNRKLEWVESIRSDLQGIGGDFSEKLKQLLIHVSPLRGELETTNIKLGELNSIKVDVQGISGDLSGQLKQMLTEDLGEQIKGVALDLRKDLHDVSERLTQDLFKQLERIITDKAPTLLEHLEQIRHSVEKQGAAPVERIVELLQQSISGGYKGETAQMSAALRELSEAIPNLTTELKSAAGAMGEGVRENGQASIDAMTELLRRVDGLVGRMDQQQETTQHLMSELVESSRASSKVMFSGLAEGTSCLVENVGKAAADAQQRNDHSIQAMDQVLARVAGLVTVMGQQREAINQAIADIGEASRSSNRRLLDQVEGAAASALTAMLQASRVEFEKILSGCRDVVQTNRSQHDEMANHIATVTRFLADSQNSMGEIVTSIRTVGNELKLVVQDARDGHIEGTKAAASLGEAANRFEEGLRHLLEVTTATSAQAQQQQLLYRELERVWPQLFERYMASFDEKSKGLLQSWKLHHEQVRILADNLGSTLNGATENFLDATNSLTEATDKLAKVSGSTS